MRSLLIAALASASLFGGVYNLKPIKVTKDITCVIGDFNPPTKQNLGFVSNVCYVNMGKSLAVLDAGPTYEFAKEFYTLMQKEYPNKKVKEVVLTNFHDDRVLGASFFKELGAKIIGYKTINDESKKYRDKFGRMPKIVPPNVYKGTKIVNADTLVDDGYKIKGSKKTLTIIKPSKVSEESSDIAVYSKDDSFVFTGNMVFNKRMLNYREESSVDGWIKALEKIKSLNAKYVFPGHGDDYSKDSYKITLDYLKILKKDVQKAYNNDIDSVDLVKQVHTQQFNYLKHFEKLNYNAIQFYYNQLEWK